MPLTVPSPTVSSAPMSWLDILFVFALSGMLIALLYWLLLGIGAYRQHRRKRDVPIVATLPDNPPLVTILVPAHNEELVIEATVRALVALDYPHKEIIVINDGSSDRTGPILEVLTQELPELVHLPIPRGQGGKGKSATLNRGLEQAQGEIIAVYDADNTPAPDALIHLVSALLANPKLAAVNGKVRTRNHNATLLSRFINIEFINFQWVFQAGRWYWFKLSTLMGTNYVIYRDVLCELGGFDEKSLVDDTEMSLRILERGQRVQWISHAVTWEQEPETLPVWFRQRVRWARGNLYVVFKYFPIAFRNPRTIGLEFLNVVLNYLIFLPTLFLSHGVFWVNVLGLAQLEVPMIFGFIWALSFSLYSSQVILGCSVEDPRRINYILGVLSYFTYAQLFVPVSLKAIWDMGRDAMLGREMRWVKTPRTHEAQLSTAPTISQAPISQSMSQSMVKITK